MTRTKDRDGAFAFNHGVSLMPPERLHLLRGDIGFDSFAAAQDFPKLDRNRLRLLDLLIKQCAAIYEVIRRMATRSGIPNGFFR
jgi:hypothetical protein